MRSQRLSLTPAQRAQAAKKLATQAHKFNHLWRAQRIASYHAFAGEISPNQLEKNITHRRSDTALFLPRITNFRLSQMKFYASNASRNTRNALGIQEPVTISQPFDPRHLDIVLVPLLAFNRKGARIGMGAGFYDRAFAFRNTTQGIKRPLLVGLAHAFQESESLMPEPWDVPLDAIITDQELIVI